MTKIVNKLKKYVEHNRDCGTHYGYWDHSTCDKYEYTEGVFIYDKSKAVFKYGKCTCGLDKLLESINE